MWSRAAAGAIGGFFLAAGLVGLVCWSLPGPWQATLVAGVSAFFPLWMIAICLAFFFSTARRAWLWLGGGALASLGLLWLLQFQGWVQ
jgi:hypothetical protein